MFINLKSLKSVLTFLTNRNSTISMPVSKLNYFDMAEAVWMFYYFRALYLPHSVNIII